VGGDEFNSPTLSPDWTVIGADASHWSSTQRPGFLTITTQDADLYEGDNRPINLFLRAAPAGDLAWCYRSYHRPQSGGTLAQQITRNSCTNVAASAEKDGRRHFPRHAHGCCVLSTVCDGVKRGRMPTLGR